MQQGTRNRKAGYESSDVVIKPILRIGLVLGLILALVLFLLWPWRSQREAEAPSFGVSPSLLSQPIANYATYRAEKDKRLHSYGWVDREKGIVHIPLQRAIQILSRAEAGKTPEADR
jgi:hypothetical protein